MRPHCEECGAYETATSGGIVHYFPCSQVLNGQAPVPVSDHGSSPVQLQLAELELKSLRLSDEINFSSIKALREKMEALEHHVADLENGLGGAIDAALKRIEQLEQQQAQWRGTQRYEPAAVEQLVDRVNQLVEFHGVLPIEVEDEE